MNHRNFGGALLMACFLAGTSVLAGLAAGRVGEKLSASVWQASYQSRNRLRNIHIDLHGQPGTVKALAGVAFGFTVTTTDPS